MKLHKNQPKICVPVVGVTLDEILVEMKKALECEADLIEWRADFYENLFLKEEILKALTVIREIVGRTPLIFTIRTKNEGGNIDICVEDYIDICCAVCESHMVELIDVEYCFDRIARREITSKAYENDVKVIMSNHNFYCTPSQKEIENILALMQESSADIAKIAVMPTCEEDVLVLMSAIESSSRELSVPLVGISMGELGKVSRICGKLIGSVITFGVAEKSSAPGQIDVPTLRKLMKEIG